VKPAPPPGPGPDEGLIEWAEKQMIRHVRKAADARGDARRRKRTAQKAARRRNRGR